jgi:O-antigen/teichoic acid export membrane protein
VTSRGSLARERSAAAGGAVMVAAFGTGALLNYAFGLALAWLLVPADFGIVGAVQNVLLLAAGLLLGGAPWALTRRIAQTHGFTDAAKPEFRTALIANSVFGLLLAAAFLGAQLSGALLVPTHSVPLVVAVAVEMPLVAVNSILGAAAVGSRRFAGAGTLQSGEILVKCVTAVCLVKLLHTGPAGVAAGFVAGTLAAILIGIRATRGLLPGRGPLARPGFLWASAAFWLASTSMTFLITADLLGLGVIGRAAGLAAGVLAGYQACAMLARASFYLSFAVGEAVFPFIARSETAEEQHRWFMAAVRWVPLLIVPVQAGLALAPEPVLRLFLPHHYAGVQPLLRVLAVGTLGALMTNMLMLALLAIGYGRQVAWRICVAAGAEVAGLITLVPRHGALGAAYSYLIAGYLGVALLAPLYLRALRVRPPAVRWLAAYSAGLAPTAAIFDFADLSPLTAAWPLILAAPFLFVVPARRMRLITDADVTALRMLRARLTGNGERAKRAGQCGFR